MMRRTVIRIIFLMQLLSLMVVSVSWAWHDETHLAIAKAAGYKKWYNAAGADITKIKAESIESPNHYFDNNEGVRVTPKTVMEQVSRYNDPNDRGGHLYGAIIGAVREYLKSKRNNKYAEYHMAFAAHYIGDLSMPLHNTPYDDFNKKHHSTNDGIVENEALGNILIIEKHMYTVNLSREHFEEDLAREIARIANGARELGLKLKKENRDMTKEEAYIQLGHSASLLKAVLGYAAENK